MDTVDMHMVVPLCGSLGVVEAQNSWEIVYHIHCTPRALGFEDWLPLNHETKYCFHASPRRERRHITTQPSLLGGQLA